MNECDNLSGIHTKTLYVYVRYCNRFDMQTGIKTCVIDLHVGKIHSLLPSGDK